MGRAESLMAAQARGFAMREAVAIVCLAGVGLVVLAVISIGSRHEGRQVQCESQVRGVMQSMINWASNGQSNYPLPSMLDTANRTVPEIGEAKNTTANIFSILVNFGGVGSDLLVCPDESNSRVRRDLDYHESNPPSAVQPANALWDPAFRADLRTGESNMSYAHLQPAGKRRSMWSDTYSDTEAVIGDRGPQVTAVRVTGDGSQPSQYAVDIANAASNTFRIHGSPRTWEGNIAFNDGHVEFLQSLAPSRTENGHWPTYSIRPRGYRLDTLFFDEPDDERVSGNLFLGIFPVAGSTPQDFRDVWD